MNTEIINITIADGNKNKLTNAIDSVLGRLHCMVLNAFSLINSGPLFLLCPLSSGQHWIPIVNNVPRGYFAPYLRSIFFFCVPVVFFCVPVVFVCVPESVFAIDIIRHYIEF